MRGCFFAIRCGLVALSMAAEALKLDISVNHIFECAKAKGFTKQGEMFSGKQVGHKRSRTFDVLNTCSCFVLLQFQT